VSFDPLSRAVLDAFRHLNERLGAIEARLDSVERDGDEWLTVAQAAKLRCCSEHALRARIRRGHIPATYDGSRIYVRRSDLA
jgi:excisionase family DNA binding protein